MFFAEHQPEHDTAAEHQRNHPPEPAEAGAGIGILHFLAGRDAGLDPAAGLAGDIRNGRFVLRRTGAGFEAGRVSVVPVVPAAPPAVVPAPPLLPPVMVLPGLRRRRPASGGRRW